MEEDLGIVDHYLLGNSSMLVETSSTKVKIRRNKLFPWLLSLPRKTLRLYVRLARLLARFKHREDVKRNVERKQARWDKAAKENEEAKQTRRNRSQALGTASLNVWRTEDVMLQALKKM